MLTGNCVYLHAECAQLSGHMISGSQSQLCLFNQALRAADDRSNHSTLFCFLQSVKLMLLLLLFFLLRMSTLPGQEWFIERLWISQQANRIFLFTLFAPPLEGNLQERVCGLILKVFLWMWVRFVEACPAVARTEWVSLFCWDLLMR